MHYTGVNSLASQKRWRHRQAVLHRCHAVSKPYIMRIIQSHAPTTAYWTSSSIAPAKSIVQYMTKSDTNGLSACFKRNVFPKTFFGGFFAYRGEVGHFCLPAYNYILSQGRPRADNMDDTQGVVERLPRMHFLARHRGASFPGEYTPRSRSARSSPAHTCPRT